MSRRQTSSSAAALTLNISPLCCAAVAVSMVNGEVGFVHRLTTTIFYDYFLLLLMFNKFWKMKEGFAFGAGLIVVGLALQFSVGPIHWSDFAFPLNGIFSLPVSLQPWFGLCVAPQSALLWIFPQSGSCCAHFALCCCPHGGNGTDASSACARACCRPHRFDTNVVVFGPLCSSISRWRRLWD